MKKKYKNLILIIFITTFLFLLIIFSKEALQEFKKNTVIFYEKLFPSSFLFITLSQILLDLNIINYIERMTHKKSYYFYVLLLSFISGFPSGSIIITSLYQKKEISLEMANKMILYAHFPNPLFVIYMGSTILNKRLAYEILISIILSNIFIYLFINKNKKETNTNRKEIDFSTSLSTSIQKSFSSILLIYGISIFFSLIAFFLCKNTKNLYIYILINNLFDLTKGITSTSLISNIIIKSYIILFFLSFTSLSIHFQTKSIIEKENISYKEYIKGRIIASLLSFLIFTIIQILNL